MTEKSRRSRALSACNSPASGVPDDAERRALVALSLVPGVGSRRMRALMSSMGSARAVLGASAASLTSVPGIRPDLAVQIAAADYGEAVEGQFSRAEEIGAEMIALRDPHYPFLLRQIHDPPVFLWMRGRLPVSNAPERMLAIVGTRRMSPYGLRVTGELTEALVRAGFSIVSGLAYGIDAAAHRAALNAGGCTIAVLGSGIDRIYPAQHSPLAEELMVEGALLSEYAMGAIPEGTHFPRRNRIVSGLALGTLVVEAYEEGGALITARLALEQNRETFAVPGSVHSPASAGVNRLIQKGEAKLVQRVEDILEELDMGSKAMSVPVKDIPVLSPQETTLCQALSTTAGPLHINTLCLSAGMDPATALVHLLDLELKGIVKQLAGKQFFLVASVGS